MSDPTDQLHDDFLATIQRDDIDVVAALYADDVENPPPQASQSSCTPLGVIRRGG